MPRKTKETKRDEPNSLFLLWGYNNRTDSESQGIMDRAVSGFPGVRCSRIAEEVRRASDPEKPAREPRFAEPQVEKDSQDGPRRIGQDIRHLGTSGYEIALEEFNQEAQATGGDDGEKEKPLPRRRHSCSLEGRQEEAEGDETQDIGQEIREERPAPKRFFPGRGQDTPREYLEF